MIHTDLNNELKNVAGVLCRKGWAEANAGNYSVNVTDEFDRIKNDLFITGRGSLDFICKNLIGKSFLISAKGARMEDMQINPENHSCYIHISENASDYDIYHSHSSSSVQPTSEITSHLSLHRTLIINEIPHKAVLHTHATEFIALSHCPDIKTSEDINTIIWNMHPEANIFLKDGVAFVPYLKTGSLELAEESMKTAKSHRLILWDKHGIIAHGKSIAHCVDLIEIATKSIRIYFMCKNAGINPEGLSDEQIMQLRGIEI